MVARGHRLREGRASLALWFPPTVLRAQPPGVAIRPLPHGLFRGGGRRGP